MWVLIQLLVVMIVGAAVPEDARANMALLPGDSLLNADQTKLPDCTTGDSVCQMITFDSVRHYGFRRDKLLEVDASVPHQEVHALAVTVSPPHGSTSEEDKDIRTIIILEEWRTDPQAATCFPSRTGQNYFTCAMSLIGSRLRVGVDFFLREDREADSNDYTNYMRRTDEIADYVRNVVLCCKPANGSNDI